MSVPPANMRLVPAASVSSAIASPSEDGASYLSEFIILPDIWNFVLSRLTCGPGAFTAAECFISGGLARTPTTCSTRRYAESQNRTVVPAPLAGIHVFLSGFSKQNVDGRDEPDS